jgi:hypothetical protein
VPVSDYAALEPYIDRARAGQVDVLTAEAPLMYAMTSGTTGRPKYIPVTRTYLREYQHGTYCSSYYALRDYPAALAARLLVLSSAESEERTPAGVPCGAISGYLARRQPALIRSLYAVPPEVTLVEDLDARYYLILRLALASRFSALLAPSPAALHLLLQKMAAWAEPLIRDVHNGTLPFRAAALPPSLRRVADRLRPQRERARALEAAAAAGFRAGDVWPDLAVASCWKGGTMGLYLPQLQERLGPVPVRELGYLATEGRGSIGLTDDTAALAVDCHFFEFIPVEEFGHLSATARTCSQVEVGRSYYVLLTTAAGLYRYHINDIVRVTGFYRGTPTIQFVRKGDGVSSITGEKLTDEHVVLALEAARREGSVPFVHCTAAPQWGQPPFYALYLEARSLPSTAQAAVLAAVVDRALARTNREYRQKRLSQRLGPPVVRPVPPGTYERYFKKRAAAGSPDVQIKLPVLSADLDFHRQLTGLEAAAE